MNSMYALLAYLAAAPYFQFGVNETRYVPDGKSASFVANGSGGPSASALAPAGLNVSLFSQIDLTTFSAGSANDIWGYTSPTGREYALVGLNNKVAFVEITDPANPVYFANIPHTASLWGDIKTYGAFAYAVTEASGTGIQVIDMTDIDNHIVTLVRTITQPGRSHNLQVDQTSGFLYTCGSRETGASVQTTTCWDLSDPSNPQKVGGSMTTSYQHDLVPVTFTEGPYAGRQILFGNGEWRGVEIWDVTDKNATFLVSSANYANVGYNHQGWLSEDKKYWYVNDELDEYYHAVLTRTLVFDVSDISNPTLVNTFTTGLPTIDHNLYVKSGFVFETNYTSGLRIFDGNDDPIDPVSSGWYDTYPANDSVSFNGTWSNYPFFPSGTVVANDMNTGLYVLDVTDATRRNFIPTDFAVTNGAATSGTIDDVAVEDGTGLVISPFGGPARPDQDNLRGGPPTAVSVEFSMETSWKHFSKMSLTLSGEASDPAIRRSLRLYDWTVGKFVQVTNDRLDVGIDQLTVSIPEPDRYLQPGTGTMRIQVVLVPHKKKSGSDWAYSFDQIGWIVNP